MPSPKPNESRQDFVNRCIPYLIREGKHSNTADGRKAAAGECYGIYDNKKKSKYKVDDIVIYDGKIGKIIRIIE